MTASTFNLYAFCTTVIQHFAVAVTFGFGNEIDVFDVGAFLEYCPVGIIVPGRSVDVEIAKQFCIDYDSIMMFKCLGEVNFDVLRINNNELIERLLDSITLMLN